METIMKALKSKTVWTLVVMFIIGGFNSVQSLFPAGDLAGVMGFLAALAAYFKLNPSQNYGG